jgi:hypothetical protein
MSERRVEAQVLGPGPRGYLRVRVAEREWDVPVDRLPSALRIPNSRFVAVVEGRELLRVELAGREWIEVQDRIRAVLNRDWDPIGVADDAADEYDGYIAGIYSMLRNDASTAELAAHLLRIEVDSMELSGLSAERRLEVARRLSALELPAI